MPIRTDGSNWEVVQGVELDEFSQGKLDASVAELSDEREAVSDLIPS